MDTKDVHTMSAALAAAAPGDKSNVHFLHIAFGESAAAATGGDDGE